MITKRRSPLGFALAASLGASCLLAQPRPNALPTTLATPETFGTAGYSKTIVSALAFYPSNNSVFYGTSGSLGRIVPAGGIVDFYASADIPLGVFIDYICLNSLTDTPFVLGFELVRRTPSGATGSVAAIDSTVHDWATECNTSALGYFFGNFADPLILHVQSNSLLNQQYFGHVEVHWRRRVSPATGPATFDDVPLGHPQRQFIEALYDSGITVGCGGNNFCPDLPLTRGQMAVFLAVALGL